MKITKSHILRSLPIAGLAAILSLSGCASAGSDSRQTNNTNYRSNLDEASRSNHNALLDPSFYNSNHEIDD